MAVNLTDLQSVGVVLATPVMAVAAALHRQAGWFIPLYLIAGMGIGISLAWTMRYVAYQLVPCRSGDSAFRQMLSSLAYLLGPPVIWMGGLSLLGRYVLHWQ